MNLSGPQLVIGGTVLVSSLLFQIFHQFHLLLFALGLVSSAICGSLLYLSLRLKFSPPANLGNCHVPKEVLQVQEMIFNQVRQNLEVGDQMTAPNISRNIDHALNELIDLISRDYIFYFFGNLMGSSESSQRILKEDFWIVIKAFCERLSKIDHVKLLAIDTVRKVTDHFEKIRVVQENNSGNGSSNSSPKKLPTFSVSPHLMSQEREIEYLIKVSETLILFLCPKSYGSCIPARHLLRELLARQILAPAINLVTSPEFINAKMLAYIQKNQSVREISVKTYQYAESFEDFISMINSTNDTNELKQIRYNILTEIMQATTMDNLIKAKSTSRLSSSRHGSNGTPSNVSEYGKSPNDFSDLNLKKNLSSPRHMKRYIQQLVHAKSVCEKRLNELGCDPYGCGGLVGSSAFDSASAGNLTEGLRKSISFESVMNSAFTRKFFYSYLEEENQQDLLGFWLGVEELRKAEKTLWHQLATELFYSYINKPNGSIHVPRTALKKIETFLMGDSGPEVFFQMQENVFSTLSETYFPAFLISDNCYKMLEEAQANGIHITEPGAGIMQTDSPSSSVASSPGGKGKSSTASPLSTSDQHVSNSSSSTEVESIQFSGHSGFAKSHLDQVAEKLQNKMQAMTALKSSLKPESKILQQLQKEISVLESKGKEVKLHLSRTESWAENLGKWRCHVQSVDNPGSGEDKENLQAILIIYLPAAQSKQGSAIEACDPENPSKTSWTCVRKINEFHSLHRELVPYVAWVKSLDLPSNSKSIFSRSSSNNKHALEKARVMVQGYLDKILSDDQLNQSEIVYAFLSPSPRHLKSYHMSPSVKKNFTPFSNFFRSDSSVANTKKSNSTDDPVGDDSSRFMFDEMDGSGMSTQDPNPARDVIAENIYGLIGEVFDMRGVFKWKSHVRDETREALIQNIPEVLVNLVGQQAAIGGTVKVFETLQNATLNKQLFYDILEHCMYETFPELMESNAAQQFKSYSL